VEQLAQAPVDRVDVGVSKVDRVADDRPVRHTDTVVDNARRIV